MDTETVLLETDRLLLFALTREQLELALYDSESLGAQLDIQVNAEVFSDESRQAMMIKISRMDRAQVRMHPWYTYFLIVRSADRRAMGVCGFKGAPSPFGVVEVGYAIHPAYRNSGYMTEAVKGLVAWGFTHAECQRITAETLRDNLASQRVLQKAGLRFDRAAENMLYWKIDQSEYQQG